MRKQQKGKERKEGHEQDREERKKEQSWQVGRTRCVSRIKRVRACSTLYVLFPIVQAMLDLKHVTCIFVDNK